MKTLIIDTSSKYLVVALYQDAKLLDAFQEQGNNRQSENAIPVIEMILKKQKLTLFDIDELIVTVGPGSYTGVRVGLTIVKVLKTVHQNFKVKVVSSLFALAGKNACISVIDARSKKIFVGIYDNGKVVKEDTLINCSDFDVIRSKYPSFKVVGDTHLVDAVDRSVCLYQNIYDIKDSLEEVSDIHQVVPHYIKEVEVTKKC